jgi:two-component system chemotaxis response regulator CheB
MVELIVIGTSAGGLDVLNKILPAMKISGLLKACVVIHLPASGPNLIPDLMSEKCSLQVKEAEPGEKILPDTIYISPPDYHLCIEPNQILSLSSEEPVNFSRPSIDLLFESAAYAYGNKVAGILLTGANSDGAKGLLKIKEAGGITIVQDTSDAEYEVMPQSALDIMKPDHVLPVSEIAKLVTRYCEKGSRDAR